MIKIQNYKFICGFFVLFIVNQSISSAQSAWVERVHSDFTDGWEYYYLDGDTATQWDVIKLKKWKIGSIIWSPQAGGLRIIGRDWDLDENGWLDAVLIYCGMGQVDIYWNDPIGFDTLNKAVLSGLNTHPQGISIGDINSDNYEDIAIAEYNNKVHIFHGGPAGYSQFADDSIVLGEAGAQHPLLTDINNDGHMDIIVSAQEKIYICYGPGPFHITPPDDSIHYPGSWFCRLWLSDLDYDNELDISVSDGSGVHLFWGPNFIRHLILNADGNADHSIADLNKDGYLDIYINHSSLSNDIIYWGSASGYNSFTYVAGNGSGDCSIEDINYDGELDIAASQLGAAAGYIMWGPAYTSYINLPIATNYQVQVVNIADFDSDSDKDVIFGGYGAPTYLYWNDAGFSSVNKFIFPDESDDALWEDLGNLWDRTNKERYLSSIFDANDTIVVDSVKWWGNFLTGISCTLWMRSALDTLTWGQWVMLTNGGTNPVLTDVRYLQYRCIFSTNYKRTSEFSFDSIKVYYSESQGIGNTICAKVYQYFDVHNFYNPFRQQTQFIFSLPKDGKVNLDIYNCAGELVRQLIDNKFYNFGIHYYSWNGMDNTGEHLASGTYLYVLDFRADDGEHRVAKKKAVILK